MLLRFVLLAACLVLVLVGPAQAQTAALTALNTEDSAPTGPAATRPAAPAVYLTAEVMPAFPGGDAALLKFMSSKLNYPAAALDHHISGKVHVTFIVDAEGRLRDPKVLRGLGYGLDDEALRLLRLLRLMPWWTPGQVAGQAVWVSITMPIVFRAL
jgi:protein TonB